MKTSKIRLAAFLLSGATVCAALTGCSNANHSAPPTQSEAPGSVQTDESSLSVKLEYYEGIIKDLEERLLNEKESSYIAAETYKQTIAELEANVEALNRKIEILSKKEPQSSADSEFKEQVAVNPDQSQNNGQQSPEFICDGNTIIKYEGNGGTVTVPERVGGITITQIGEEAFKNSNVEKMILSDNIEYIDWFAFSGCKNLSEIYIPASVTSIGYGAFDNCSSFLVIKCPKGSYAEAFAKSWGIIVIAE